LLVTTASQPPMAVSRL